MSSNSKKNNILNTHILKQQKNILLYIKKLKVYYYILYILKNKSNEQCEKMLEGPSIPSPIQ